MVGQNLNFMKKERISLNFSSYNDKKLEKKAAMILASISGNVSFTDFIPAIQNLRESLKNFKSVREIMIGYESYIMAEETATRESLIYNLKQLGQHVIAVSKDDVGKLASSGYSSNSATDQIVVELINNCFY